MRPQGLKNRKWVHTQKSLCGQQSECCCFITYTLHLGWDARPAPEQLSSSWAQWSRLLQEGCRFANIVNMFCSDQEILRGISVSPARLACHCRAGLQQECAGGNSLHWSDCLLWSAVRADASLTLFYWEGDWRLIQWQEMNEEVWEERQLSMHIIMAFMWSPTETLLWLMNLMLAL